MYKTDGYSYKTLVIPTSAGVREYNISTTFANGLPPNAVLTGIFCRVYPTSGGLAYNSQPLINRFIEQNAFVNLQKNNGHAIIENRSYRALSRETQYFEPVKVADFDFNASTIKISQATLDSQIVNGEYFELVFFYQDPCDTEQVPVCTQVRQFANLDGERFKLLEIPVNSTQTIYQLSTSLSVGLPENAILTGIGLNESVSPTGKRVFSTNAQQASFVELKAKSRTYVEKIPWVIAQNVVPRIYFNKFYIPVTPRKVDDIDWDNSNIIIVDPSRITATDTVVLIGLYYVMP